MASLPQLQGEACGKISFYIMCCLDLQWNLQMTSEQVPLSTKLPWISPPPKKKKPPLYRNEAQFLLLPECQPTELSQQSSRLTLQEPGSTHSVDTARPALHSSWLSILPECNCCMALHKVLLPGVVIIREKKMLSLLSIQSQESCV